MRSKLAHGTGLPSALQQRELGSVKAAQVHLEVLKINPPGSFFNVLRK